MHYHTAVVFAGECYMPYNIVGSSMYNPLSLRRRPGRPYYVAIIPISDQLLQLKTQFFDIIDSLSYRELRAVSRAVGVHSTTAEGWKYMKHFPRLQTAFDVIAWDRAGRPVQKVYQGMTADRVM